jgi:hypothetical protein
MAVEDRVEGHLVREVLLLEVGGLLLKLFQRVQPTLLKPELAVANEAPWAVPFRFWLGLEGRVEASAVITMVAGLAREKKVTLLITSATLLAFLVYR